MIPIVRLTLKKDGILPFECEKIYGCEEAAPILIDRIGMCARECIGLICVDSHNRILNYSEISFGKIDEVAIDYASILKTALLSNAKAIVIGHNHPSNILKPSETDIEMTKKIAGLCNIFGINLIDSIIVVPNGDYLSIRTYIQKVRKE